MNEMDDPFAELMAWSNPAQLRPLPLQRTLSDCTSGARQRSHTYCSMDRPVAPLLDAPIVTNDARRRCNTVELDPSTSTNNENRPTGQPNSPQIKFPNKYINVITPDNIITDSTHSNSLLVFEDDSRVRTSTLESVMAVKSLSTLGSAMAVKSIGSGGERHMHDQDVRSQAWVLQDWEVNDAKSDVSSLSEFEHRDEKQTSPTPSTSGARVGGAISSLFKKKRPMIRPLRLRSESRSTGTATTAVHTLETIDKFDVPSALSPLGALSGREELSFFKSAASVKEQEFASLHGYHRRRATSSLVRTNSGGHLVGIHGGTHLRNPSDQVQRIQNSWLVPTCELGDDDLIDMEHEVDDLNLSGPSSSFSFSQTSSPLKISFQTLPTIGASTSGAASIASKASSHMQSLQDITTMSTGEQSGNSKSTSQKLSARPPIVARAKTSPAVFKNDDPTSRLKRVNPAFQRQRPPQISTAAISPCMIGSTIAEAISPKVSGGRMAKNCNTSVASISVNTHDGLATPSLPSLEEDDEDASFDSFDEELRRKNKVKMIGREVKHIFKHLDPKPAVNKGKRILGLKVQEHELKRAEGCLT